MEAIVRSKDLKQAINIIKSINLYKNMIFQTDDSSYFTIKATDGNFFVKTEMRIVPEFSMLEEGLETGYFFAVEKEIGKCKILPNEETDDFFATLSDEEICKETLISENNINNYVNNVTIDSEKIKNDWDLDIKGCFITDINKIPFTLPEKIDDLFTGDVLIGKAIIQNRECLFACAFVDEIKLTFAFRNDI